jgi:hypothetical protein
MRLQCVAYSEERRRQPPVSPTLPESRLIATPHGKTRIDYRPDSYPQAPARNITRHCTGGLISDDCLCVAKVYRRLSHTTENNGVYVIEISETDCEVLQAYLS